MTTTFQDRHFGMNGEVAELDIPATALRTGHGTGYPLPGGYDELAH